MGDFEIGDPPRPSRQPPHWIGRRWSWEILRWGVLQGVPATTYDAMVSKGKQGTKAKVEYVAKNLRNRVGENT
jgi:hypothetical protein